MHSISAEIVIVGGKFHVVPSPWLILNCDILYNSNYNNDTMGVMETSAICI